MIYVVSNQQDIFKNTLFERISFEKSIEMMINWRIIQFDTETSKINPREGKLLAFQFGNDEADTRIVVDATTIDIELYKDLIETKFIIGQNIKFDLQFLYYHNIKPTNVYDTMIAEQILHLGMNTFKDGGISFSLQDIVKRRLSVDIDKTARGEIIYRGLVNRVIEYAANDVTHLEKIMWSQVEEAKKLGCLEAIRMECNAIPAIAYMQYCGLCIDQKRLDEIVVEENGKLLEAEAKLNNHVLQENDPMFTRSIQLSLFEDNDEPSCNIVWSNPQSVERYTKVKGVDCIKDLLDDYNHHLSITRDWNEILHKHIDKYDSRIHADWWQIGTKSSRMTTRIPNIQGIPEELKNCIKSSNNDTVIISADYECIEPRIIGCLSKDKTIKQAFDNGGDPYSMLAKLLFNDELNSFKIKDIKNRRPDLRDKAKIQFLKYIYGGNVYGESEYNKLFKELYEWKTKAKSYIDANPIVKISPFGHIFHIVSRNDKTFESVISSQNQCIESCCTKIALTKLFKAILENVDFNKVKIINCIHDSIILEVPYYLESRYVDIIKHCMKDSFTRLLNDNISVDCKQNSYWS